MRLSVIDMTGQGYSIHEYPMQTVFFKSVHVPIVFHLLQLLALRESLQLPQSVITNTMLRVRK